MSKAKPTPARQPDTEELAAVVWSRLYSDDEYNDDRLHKWLATQPPASAKDVAALNYRTAKQRARNGDLAPLRKFLTNLTGDPDIAQYIARPHQPKHARKDYADSQPFTQEAMRIQGDNVRRIRQIRSEERR